MKSLFILCAILLTCCIPGVEALTYEYAAQWGEMGPTNEQFNFPYGIGTDCVGKCIRGRHVERQGPEVRP